MIRIKKKLKCVSHGKKYENTPLLTDNNIDYNNKYEDCGYTEDRDHFRKDLWLVG
jgi:hypothetical protein